MKKPSLLQVCVNELLDWMQACLSCIPGQTGSMLRGYIYSFIFKSAGKKIAIGQHVYIYSPQNLIIGNNSGFNHGCIIDASGGLKIGNDVLIAPNVAIITAEHNYLDTHSTIRNQGWSFKNVVIEDNVWINTGCIITAGVRIGYGSVIAAGAVVTKDVPPRSFMTGVPAVIKRKIK